MLFSHWKKNKINKVSDSRSPSKWRFSSKCMQNIDQLVSWLMKKDRWTKMYGLANENYLHKLELEEFPIRIELTLAQINS